MTWHPPFLRGTFVFLILAAGCDSLTGPKGDWQADVAHDLATPEGAVLSLYDAYAAGDVEAAVKCKDFRIEAELILEDVDDDLTEDAEILAKTAEVLELGFRGQTADGGFPPFGGAVKTARIKYPVRGRDDRFRVTERFIQRDGTMVINKLLVAKTPDGWKVITLVEE